MLPKTSSVRDFFNVLAFVALVLPRPIMAFRVLVCAPSGESPSTCARMPSAWLAAWLQAYETCMEHDWGLVLCYFCPCLCQLWGWGHECCLQWILAHTLNHSGKLDVRCMFPTYLYIYHGGKCVHCACGAMLLVTSH